MSPLVDMQQRTTPTATAEDIDRLRLRYGFWIIISGFALVLLITLISTFISLPRTRVNKGKKPRGRDPVEPRPVTQMIVDALLVTHLHSRALAHHLAHDFSPLPQRSIPVE